MVSQIGGTFSASPIMNEPTMTKVERPTNIQVSVSDAMLQNQNQGTNEKRDQIEKIVSSMNDFLQASPNTHLKFEFHDKLNEYYVTIVDEQTQEIVREIPPKKMLDMFAAMTEFLGLMVDKKI